MSTREHEGRLLWQRGRRLVTGALLLALLQLPIAVPRADAIPDGSHISTRPTLWAPNYAESQMGYKAWGNVAYFFTWHSDQSPQGLKSYGPEWGFELPSLEIGWKRTGWAGCRTTNSLNGSSGFPSDVYRGVDYTEDSGDAVLFVGDMQKMKLDQISNPGRIYSAWWGCGGGNFVPTSRPYFNVSIGNQNRPAASYTHATLNYVPGESGHHGFPSTNPAPGMTATTQMLTPWTRGGNFERGVSNWAAHGTTADQICGTADQGYCFVRAYGNNTGVAWLYTADFTWNRTAQEGQAWRYLPIGSNTGLQYEGAFRCRSAFNSSPCYVDIWLKGRNGLSWDASRDAVVKRIPNDDKWYFVLNDALGGAGGQTEVFDLWINTRGRVLDVDAQWVSSDY